MASITPARRVLSERNVNTPTGRVAIQPSKFGTGSPAKAQRMGDTSLQTELKLKEDAWGAIHQEAQMGSRKRESDIHMDVLPSKRHKTVSSAEDVHEAVLYRSRGDQSSGGGAEETAVLRSPVPRKQNPVYDNRSSPSASSSPTSSLGSRLAGLDDSQNTSITELDDVPLPTATFIPTLSHPISVPLTKAEIREKAEVLKLRLKLASYKVRTNQINIPMSRLQIKTLASTQPELPHLPRQAANTSQRRNPLPGAATALPDVRLQTPSADQRRAHHNRIHSSPPPYLDIPTTKRQVELNFPTKEANSTAEHNTEDCTTPLLPRQRDGLFHPPNLGSPVWNDLTSSVVKGHAADGLLSLMRQ